MIDAPGPSERLCEIGLDLAISLNRYEEAGGASHLSDVIVVPPFADVFDSADSVAGKSRPQWRWEIRLRQGRDVETVVGHANGPWTVDGLDRLAHAAALEGPGVVVIEPHGADLKFKPPRADTTAGTEAVSSQINLPGTFSYARSLVARGMRKSIGHRPPRWHSDPARRHGLRYWNGVRWTRFVFDPEAAPSGWDASLEWGNRYRLPKGDEASDAPHFAAARAHSRISGARKPR